jgi:hypothetical protein
MTKAQTQDIINYMFAVWVRSGMYCKDFDRHVIDMMNRLLTWTIVCCGDDDDDLGIVPLREIIEVKGKISELPPIKVYCVHGENIRYIPDIDMDFLHSPLSEECLDDMAIIAAVALREIMREEPNNNAARWIMYEMSVGPIYDYEICNSIGGIGGGCATIKQLLLGYEQNYAKLLAGRSRGD